MPSGSLECLYTSVARSRYPLHFLDVKVTMEILCIVTLVPALGAMEEAIQPSNGRESIDVDGCLVLCSNMILASRSG